MDRCEAECNCPSSNYFFSDLVSYKSLSELLSPLDSTVAKEEDYGGEGWGYDPAGYNLKILSLEQLNHDLFNLKLDRILKMDASKPNSGLFLSQEILKKYQTCPHTKKYYSLLTHLLESFKKDLKQFLKNRIKVLAKQSFLTDEKLSKVCENVALIIVRFDSDYQNAFYNGGTHFMIFHDKHYSD